MTTASDRLVGLNGFTAWKPPVRVATIGNATLSGEQTIDGVAVVANDRVLVKDQTTATENGIYVASTGAWTRAKDFNGARDVVSGTSVLVTSGTTQSGYWYRVTNNGTVTIGSTSIAFGRVNTGAWVNASEYGSGATGINAALSAVSAAGGGTVLVTDTQTISARIVGQDKARLFIPRGITLTLDTSVTAAMVYGEDVPQFQIAGGGKLVPAGYATYAVQLLGQSDYPIDGLEITGHKGGVRVEANATSGVGNVKIRDLYVHDNYVHPTDPDNLSLAGHYLSISCRPSQGYDRTESVTLDGVRLIAAEAGAYTAGNDHSKDLLSIQGANKVSIRNFHSRNSGEVGASITFGCWDVQIEDSLIEYADGHGLLFSGAHYMIKATVSAGNFAVANTVTGGTSTATGDIEYLIQESGSDYIMWLENPSLLKIQSGETITNGTGGTATVTEAWPAFNNKALPSVTTRGNGIDVGGIADYAGLTAQHVVEPYLSGTHIGNKPFGMTFNSCLRYAIGDTNIELDATQTERISQVGSSTFQGRYLSPMSIADPAAADGDDQDHVGVFIDGNQRLVLLANEAESGLVNRTGASGDEYGDVIQIARNSTITGSLGTDGIQFPQNTATGAFSHSTLPAAAGATRKINYSSSSRGSDAALVRSDGTSHIDLVTGLPSRASVWTKSTIEAETGTIVGGSTRIADGVGGEPALSVWGGSAWEHVPTTVKGGTATIADTNTSVSVSFGTSFSGTSYTIVLTSADPAQAVGYSSKATSGFDIDRSGSSGVLAVDWLAIPQQDP